MYKIILSSLIQLNYYKIMIYTYYLRQFNFALVVLDYLILPRILFYYYDINKPT